MNEEPVIIDKIEFDQALRKRCTAVGDDVLAVFAFQLRDFLAEVTLRDAWVRPAANDVLARNRLALGLLTCLLDGAGRDCRVLRVEAFAREYQLRIEFINPAKTSVETGQNPAMTR